MEKWYSRFRRGDVWYLHLSTETGDGNTNSSVQKKSRPYVIVSCEENNLNSMTFNVIPITTRDSDHLPMHVYFRYEDGSANARNQLVLCEQITTVSILAFNDPKSHFMYSFNEEFMLKIDEALTRQLGLKPRVADMTVLERIVKELAEAQVAEIKKQKEKEAGMRVEELATFLAKKFNIELTAADLQNGTEYRDAEMQYADKATVQTMRETAAERRKQPKSELQAVCDEASITKTQLPTEDCGKANPTHLEQSRSKRCKWTLEEKKQFLADYSALPVGKMAEKYGLKKSSVAYNACVFRKEVAKIGTEESI